MLALTLAVPAFALEESDVEAAVSSSSREAVTGNVLVWFLCAVGFLKVSQKIDSFMASIGVNVGHTGGSMLGEAMVAFKGVSLAAGMAGKVVGNFADRASSRAGATASGSSGFLQGGLAGVVSRKITNDAVRTATQTTQKASSSTMSAAHQATERTVNAERQAASVVHQAKQTRSESASQKSQMGVTHQQVASSTRTASVSSLRRESQHSVGLGRRIFTNSMLEGGRFANDVIGTSNTNYWTTRLLHDGTPYSYKPPMAAGKILYCLDRGYGYRGKYYTLTDQRIPYRRDKTEDERFFILTLFAIAHEIEAMGQYSGSLMRVQLAVGLPPAHFGVQAKRFINYFNGRGAVAFQFKGKPYAIFIENTACFPQSFSAAAATVKNLASFPRALVVDIGGFTADYVRLRNGVPDMAACDSLENGVILLYNRICAKANAELDILLEESEIDRILRGEDQDAAPEVIALTEREAQEFINDLLSGLRERMLELKSGKVIFLGGGATLLRRQIEASGKIGQAIFVEDINANAKGYEYLYRLQHSGR